MGLLKLPHRGYCFTRENLYNTYIKNVPSLFVFFFRQPTGNGGGEHSAI